MPVLRDRKHGKNTAEFSPHSVQDVVKIKPQKMTSPAVKSPPRTWHRVFTFAVLRGRPSAFTLPKSRVRPSAFTLVEMLVVIAIIALLMVLVAPAFTSLKGAGDVTNAAYTIKGVLEQARTTAMASNTYSWVGFYEEDASVPSANPP